MEYAFLRRLLTNFNVFACHKRLYFVGFNCFYIYLHEKKKD